MCCPAPIDEAVEPPEPDVDPLAVEPLPDEPPAVLPVDPEPPAVLPDPVLPAPVLPDPVLPDPVLPAPVLLPDPDIDPAGASVPVTSTLCPLCADRSCEPGSRM
jgi:hypothetical protein